MAGGWSRDGAVNEQIEASIGDELARMRARQSRAPAESRTHCAECDEPIPQRRRDAVPGVQLCVSCQQTGETAFRPTAGFNRRGSKDSQLK